MFCGGNRNGDDMNDCCRAAAPLLRKRGKEVDAEEDVTRIPLI
jgi:hypothetical protein